MDEIVFDLYLAIKSQISNKVNDLYEQQFRKYGWSMETVSNYLEQERLETVHIGKNIEWRFDGKPIFIEHREISDVFLQGGFFKSSINIWFEDVKGGKSLGR